MIASVRSFGVSMPMSHSLSRTFGPIPLMSVRVRPFASRGRVLVRPGAGCGVVCAPDLVCSVIVPSLFLSAARIGSVMDRILAASCLSSWVGCILLALLLTLAPLRHFPAAYLVKSGKSECVAREVWSLLSVLLTERTLIHSTLPLLRYLLTHSCLPLSPFAYSYANSLLLRSLSPSLCAP